MATKNSKKSKSKSKSKIAKKKLSVKKSRISVKTERAPTKIEKARTLKEKLEIAEINAKKTRPTAAEKLAKIDPADLAKYKGDESGIKELSKIFNTLKRGYTTRRDRLYELGINSPAVLGVEEYSEAFTGTAGQLKKEYKGNLKALRNRLIAEIGVYQNFFRNKTSSILEALKAEYEMNKRIYGADDFGELKYQMSLQESRNYWNFYNEYMRQNPNQSFDSDKVQSIIADLMFADRAINLSYDFQNRELNGDIASAIELTRQSFNQSQLKEAEEEYNRNGGFNVFSGFRND